MSSAVDQATELRKLVAHSQRRPAGRSARAIAISSGKGGVGKSNVAVNLAARLAQMGRRVALLDADMGTANADVLCGVRASATLAHVVAGRKQLEDAIVRAPGGFSLIPGASGLAKMAELGDYERARLIDMFGRIDDAFDLLLIDTGAGIGPNVLGFVEAADEALIVTTSEPTAVTDAYALIKTLRRRGAEQKLSVLVNMARHRAEAEGVYTRINAVCRRFLNDPVADAGFIPADARVATAVRRRVPFVVEAPECPASRAVGMLAHKLDRHAAVDPRSRGLLKRVASWLVC